VIAGLTILVAALLPTDAEVRRLTERKPAGRESSVQGQGSSVVAAEGD
jgi:hypothetical protein